MVGEEGRKGIKVKRERKEKNVFELDEKGERERERKQKRVLDSNCPQQQWCHLDFVI